MTPHRMFQVAACAIVGCATAIGSWSSAVAQAPTREATAEFLFKGTRVSFAEDNNRPSERDSRASVSLSSESFEENSCIVTIKGNVFFSPILKAEKATTIAGVAVLPPKETIVGFNRPQYRETIIDFSKRFSDSEKYSFSLDGKTLSIAMTGEEGLLRVKYFEDFQKIPSLPKAYQVGFPDKKWAWGWVVSAYDLFAQDIRFVSEDKASYVSLIYNIPQALRAEVALKYFIKNFCPGKPDPFQLPRQ